MCSWKKPLESFLQKTMGDMNLRKRKLFETLLSNSLKKENEFMKSAT